MATAPATATAIGRVALGASAPAAVNQTPDVEEPSELAAYTSVTSLILNLNETVMKE